MNLLRDKLYFFHWKEWKHRNEIELDAKASLIGNEPFLYPKNVRAFYS